MVAHVEDEHQTQVAERDAEAEKALEGDGEEGRLYAVARRLLQRLVDQEAEAREDLCVCVCVCVCVQDKAALTLGHRAI